MFAGGLHCKRCGGGNYAKSRMARDRLFTGRDLTFPIEQDNSNVRGRLARLRRRIKAVSKCRPMVDLSLCLLHHLQQPAAFVSYAKQLAAALD